MIKASIALVLLLSIWSRVQGGLEELGNCPWEGVTRGAMVRQDGRAFLQIIHPRKSQKHPLTPPQTGNCHQKKKNISFPLTDTEVTAGCFRNSRNGVLWCWADDKHTWNHFHQAPHTKLDIYFDKKDLPFIPSRAAPTHTISLRLGG